MTRIERTIIALKQRLGRLGPMLPGSLNEQWNVCGTPGCRCKDPHHPAKHGPYYQVSFAIQGRSSTLFVKKGDVKEVRRRLDRCRRFKALALALAQAYVDLARAQGFTRS